MSRPALLDVNVLVALFDPDHVHHDVAHDWFSEQRAHGWVTSSVTENGLIRVLTNPRYGSPIAGVSAIADRLRQFRQSGGHTMWPDDVSLCDDAVFDVALVRGHRQVTDVYLLGLAHAKGGCLATFDQSIPLNAVRGADRRSLALIAEAT